MDSVGLLVTATVVGDVVGVAVTCEGEGGTPAVLGA